MAYTNIETWEPVSGVRGTAYDAQSDSVYFIERGSGSTSTGRVKALRVTPYKLVAQGLVELFDTLSLDGIGDDTDPDLTWDGTSLRPIGFTELATLSNMSVDPAELPDQAFQTAPLPEDGNGDHSYAVITNSLRYSKLRIFRDTQDSNRLKAQWMTYEISSEPETVSNNYRDPRDILLTVENGVTVAYITAVIAPRSNQLQAVIYRSPSTEEYGSQGFEDANPTNIVAKWAQVNTPVPQSWVGAQQMDMHLGRLFVVYNNTLALVDPATRSYTDLYTALDRAVGLAISADGLTAYVTDMMSGGRLVRLRLDPVTGQASDPVVLLTGLGRPGFLNWADEARTALHLCKNETNEVLRLEELTGSPSELRSTVVIAATQGLTAPWSAEFVSEGKTFIASDVEIGYLENSIEVAPGVLVLGIGLLPFTYIEQDLNSPDVGRADTTGTGYFFQVNNVPFGGTLNLMMYHEGAYDAGARYYKLRFLQGGNETPITNSFTDFLWNADAARFDPYTTSLINNGRITGAFEIRAPDKLFYNPYLAATMDTRRLSNGLATLEVTFYNEFGTKLESFTASRHLRIDNNRVSARLSLPVIGGVVQNLTSCGTLSYHAKPDDFRFEFAATHPNNDAEYSLYIQRGNTVLSALTERGSVANAASPKVTTVQDVLGACNVGNVYIRLDVAARVTDGYRWINSTAASLSFTLVPDTMPAH
jgi:hypothetical protein